MTLTDTRSPWFTMSVGPGYCGRPAPEAKPQKRKLPPSGVEMRSAFAVRANGPGPAMPGTSARARPAANSPAKASIAIRIPRLFFL